MQNTTNRWFNHCSTAALQTKRSLLLLVKVRYIMLHEDRHVYFHYAFLPLITTVNLVNLCWNNSLLLLLQHLCFSCLLRSNRLSKRRFLKHKQSDGGARNKRRFNWCCSSDTLDRTLDRNKTKAGREMKLFLPSILTCKCFKVSPTFR